MSTTDSPIELLPCPWCGKNAEQGRTAELWDDKKDFPKFGLSCPDKNCFGNCVYCKFSSLKDAATAWNTRAAMQTKPQFPLDDSEICKDDVEKMLDAYLKSTTETFSKNNGVNYGDQRRAMLCAIAAMPRPATGWMPIDLNHICNQIDAFMPTSEDEWGSKSRALLASISKALRDALPSAPEGE